MSPAGVRHTYQPCSTCGKSFAVFEGEEDRLDCVNCSHKKRGIKDDSRISFDGKRR